MGSITLLFCCRRDSPISHVRSPHLNAHRPRVGPLSVLPATRFIGVLRVTPRSHSYSKVARWTGPGWLMILPGLPYDPSLSRAFLRGPLPGPWT